MDYFSIILHVRNFKTVGISSIINATWFYYRNALDMIYYTNVMDMKYVIYDFIIVGWLGGSVFIAYQSFLVI